MRSQLVEVDGVADVTVDFETKVAACQVGEGIAADTLIAALSDPFAATVVSESPLPR